MNSAGENPAYFKEAVKSILTQEDINIHLILSTIENDPSIEWIKAHKGDITTFVTPLEGHPGRGPAGSFYQLNKALKAVRYEYFVFMSSNDVMLPNKYHKEIEAAESKGGYMGYSDFVMTDQHLTRGSECRFGAFQKDRHWQTNFIPDQSVINSNKLWKLLPFNEAWFNCGYWDFWMRVYEEFGDVFGYYNGITRLYRQEANQMHVVRRNNKEDQRLHEKHKGEMLKHHKAIRQQGKTNFV